jgi:RNA polymerase sigma-70 factor, ECF subfamily
MKKNKEEQFKDLVKENHGRILSICKSFSNSASDSNDLYQEILVNIWQCLENFRGESSIHTWVYRVAMNTAITNSNKSFKIRSTELFWDDQKMKHFIEEEVEPGIEDQLKQLHAELNQLSIIDKALITLVLEELSTREIADIIGISEPNVRVKIHRIKETLKVTFKNIDNE